MHTEDFLVCAINMASLFSQWRVPSAILTCSIPCEQPILSCLEWDRKEAGVFRELRFQSLVTIEPNGKGLGQDRNESGGD